MVGFAEIILAKHRNGPVGDVHLRFREEMAKFVELDDMEIGSLPGENKSIFTVGSKMNNDESSERTGNDMGNKSYSDEEEPF